VEAEAVVGLALLSSKMKALEMPLEKRREPQLVAVEAGGSSQEVLQRDQENLGLQ